MVVQKWFLAAIHAGVIKIGTRHEVVKSAEMQAIECTVPGAGKSKGRSHPDSAVALAGKEDPLFASIGLFRYAGHAPTQKILEDGDDRLRFSPGQSH